MAAVACWRCMARRTVLSSHKVSNSQLIKSRIANFIPSAILLQNRQSSTEAPLAAPHPDGLPKPPSEKILSIVDSISKLTLSEVADLNLLLKSTLNIADAPVMAVGAMAQSAPASAEEEEAPKEVQTEFSVKLVKFDADAKLKVIKELKKILTTLNVVQVKKFIESVPQVVKEKVPKEEADELKKVLESVGGSVEIE